MNVNKKFDRLRQWGKEKMGVEIKTATTDDFKALEIEMACRHEGVEKLHNAMSIYIKSIMRRVDGEGKEKTTPVAFLGSTMTRHGEDFEEKSRYGQSLTSVGRANERIARMQESYAATATSTWLESLERSLAQMKDYQAARKRLESRRLAYDTSITKMHKAKKEDFKTEEELRSQKAKYEESGEDVDRRMQDIIEAESSNIADLHQFLQAELAFHDRCREVLLQAKREWPLESEGSADSDRIRHRSRSNTLNMALQSSPAEELLVAPRAPFLGSSSRSPSYASSPQRELPGFDFNAPPRPSRSRAATNDSITRPILSRVPTNIETTVRPTPSYTFRNRATSGADIFSDPEDANDTPDLSYDGETSSSLGASVALTSISRETSYSTLDNPAAMLAKMKPPPPPSRGSKPPPPPPPMKRSALSSSQVPRV